MRTRQIECVMQFGDSSISVFYSDRAPHTFWRTKTAICLPAYVQKYIEHARYRLEYKKGDEHASVIGWSNELPDYGFMAYHLHDADMRITEKAS